MNNDIPITRTKVLVPRRRTELLSRRRLIDTLSELLDNRLVIIAAPAGYGKTSLMIDMAQNTKMPVCWYALDTPDRDPQRFIAHFIAALQVRFPRFGQSSFAALRNTTQDNLNLDGLTSTIINDAYDNISEHFIIVLDDYHMVDDSKAINYFVNRFIQDADENCHMLIASRILLTLPDLPLMVARNQVGGLSFEELVFRADEIQSLLLQNYHMTISDQMATELEQQSEGWITGLLLSTQTPGAGLNERLRTARVSGVGLYEYLAQQVLEQQPENVQRFLLRTSLFDEFDSQLCQEVVGKALDLPDENWDALMDTVFRHNLFVLPVGEDSAHLWLRYHHLFRNFLYNRMTREFPQEAEQIQLQLATTFYQRGEWERAYSLFQRLNKGEAIADLVERAGSNLVVTGRLVTLSDWLENLPSDVLSTRPVLVSLQGTVAVMRGETRQGLALFNQAAQAQEKAGAVDQLAQTLILKSGAYRLVGEYRLSLNDAEEALRLTAGRPELLKIQADAQRARGINLYQQGKLKDALVSLQDSLKNHQAVADSENSARLQTEIGLVYEALGEYKPAEEAYTSALHHFQAAGNSVWQANLLNNLGVLHHVRGNYEEATRDLEQSILHARSAAYPRLEAFALASIGDIYRDLDAIHEAYEAYRQSRLIAQPIRDQLLLIYIDLGEAVLARLQQRFEPAHERLDSAVRLAEEGGSRFEQSLCQLERGSLMVAEGNFRESIPILGQVAVYFSDEGHLAQAARAHLFLAAAFNRCGDKSMALTHFKQVHTLLAEAESQHPLIMAGREIQDDLEEMREKSELGTLANNLLREVTRFESRLSALRRMLRHRAMAVPFAPPKMVIRALGRMQVRISGKPVSSAAWQTQTARDMFFFLLLHPEGLTKEAIGLHFWPDSSTAELKLRFKNTMYRLRHALGKEVIAFSEEYYRFNRTLDFDYDVESYQKELEQARTLEDPQKKIAHYRAALKYYRGAFLPELSEQWAVTERERLHQSFLDTLLKLAALHLESGQHEAAIADCHRALVEDPCLEAAHRLAMRTHAAMGNRAAIARQFEQCQLALLQEIGASPSQQTVSLYETLVKSD